MTDRIVYHICRAEEWQAARGAGRYAGSTQDAADGFIHFSAADQVVDSAARHRAGQDGLVLIAADAAVLGAALIWEPSRGGRLFPHLYGDLPVAAVVGVHPLPLGKDGRFMFPALSADDPAALGWPDPGGAGSSGAGSGGAGSGGSA